MRRADKFTTSICRLSSNLGASNFWKPTGLSKPVMGLIYFHILKFMKIRPMSDRVVPCGRADRKIKRHEANRCLLLFCEDIKDNSVDSFLLTWAVMLKITSLIFQNLSSDMTQMKHQLDATLCSFYFCRVTLHVSGASAHHQEYLKTSTAATGTCVIVAGKSSHLLIRAGTPCIIVWVKWNTNLMQHCAVFISSESFYMFRAQAHIIRSI